MITIEELINRLPDSELMEVEQELLSGVVPAGGHAQELRHRLNAMINKGTLCINPMTYRLIYLPSLAKMVHMEMARRYVEVRLCQRQ